MPHKQVLNPAVSRTHSYWLGVAAGLLLVVSAGAIYGKYSQRWGPPVDLTAAGSELNSLPNQIGDWKLVEQMQMDKETTEILQCAGALHRRYVNERTGQAVGLAIIVGPPGPTSVHTPEICFSSRAYSAVGDRRQVEFDSLSGEKHSFWSLDFTPGNVLADNLRVYYAWSSGSTWEASESPRFEFAAEPLLYKLQLAGTISPGSKDEAADACHYFLEAFLRSGWLTVRQKRSNRIC